MVKPNQSKLNWIRSPLSLFALLNYTVHDTENYCNSVLDDISKMLNYTRKKTWNFAFLLFSKHLKWFGFHSRTETVITINPGLERSNRVLKSNVQEETKSSVFMFMLESLPRESLFFFCFITLSKSFGWVCIMIFFFFL